MLDHNKDDSSLSQGQFGGRRQTVLALRYAMAAKYRFNEAEAEEHYRARAKELMRKFREGHGWSQQTIADKLGISKATYQKLEGVADRGIKATFAAHFCDTFNIDLQFFLTGEASAASQEAMRRPAEFPPAVVRRTTAA